MKNVISCKLMGGLGNQMFQSAHAIAQGIKHDRESVFLPKSWTPMQGRQTENYIDNIFRNLKFVDEISDSVTINEGPWEYSLVTPSEKNTIFEGYFQSSKNFLGYDDYIRELFSPTDDFIQDILNKYPELSYPNTVSIHIRRGDYSLNQDIHPIITQGYINRALDEVGNYSHVFIFGDDKEWCRNYLNYENSTIIDEEDYKEIWMMSLCKNNIIGNSTFSWWGSFLNQNKNKKVVAPSIWFGPRGPQNYRDIYESNWTVLDVKYENGWLS
jgi:hypothetical protein